MSDRFDFEAALKAIQSGQSITGKVGVLAALVKQLTEAALEGELESHLAEDLAGNRRNGKSKKTVKSASGAFELETPRHRVGTFEPKLVNRTSPAMCRKCTALASPRLRSRRLPTS